MSVLILLIVIGLYLLYKYLAEENPKKKNAFKLVLIVDVVLFVAFIAWLIFCYFWAYSLMDNL